MSDMAKQARAAMKAKAKSLTSADPHQKVDSSTWSPAEPLNADVKTGLRPVSRRAFKSGGKVQGEKAKCSMGRKPRKSGGEATSWVNAKINRNVKDANEERAGIKHVGGMKKGGRTKKEIGGAMSMLSPALMAMNALRGDKDEKKRGGRTGKNNGGGLTIEEIIEKDKSVPAANPGPMTRAEAGIKPGVTNKAANAAAFDKEQQEYQRKMPQNRNAGGRTKKLFGGFSTTEGKPYGGPAAMIGRKSGGRAKKMLGGPLMNPQGMMAPVANATGSAQPMTQQQPLPTAIDPNDQRFNMVSPQTFNFGQGAKGTPYKKGGAVKHSDEAADKALFKKMEKAESKKEGHEDEAMDKALIRKMVKPEARTKRKEGGGVFSGPGYPGKVPGVVPGGRDAHARGGKTRGKGKTNINILIAAGGKQGPGMGMTPPGGPTPPPGMDGGPGGVPVPMPAPQQGGPGVMPMPIPMPMPMPGGGAGAGAPPAARARGGRLTKVASSYKDMEAGAGGGEGRLQKTDIAKKHKDAPAFRRGGKAYRSYKDMDAGAGSGLGRLEKTEIQARKG